MAVYDSVLDLIGRTPIVKLCKLSDGLAKPVYAKLEKQNPGGSIKDRAALNMIRDAEQKGALRKGMPVIEPTSGNTGVGLAMVCAYLGYEATLVMPSSMSKERRDLLTAFGAHLVLTDAALGMQGAVDEANRLLAEHNGFCPSQFSNPANAAAHIVTAAEIAEDMQAEGGLDALIATVGTSGTICGLSMELRKSFPSLRVIGVEPEESPLLAQGKAGKHGIQGIGANFVPVLYDPSLVDELVTVSTADAFAYTKILAREEGLLCGISSGAAVCATLRIAQRAEFAGKNVLCILPDTGERYLSSGVFS